MDDGGSVDWIIEIDRIVIEGVPLTYYQLEQLKGSLTAELERMFAGRSMPGIMRPVQGKVTGAPVQLQGSSPVPVQLMKQVAATVYKSLSGE